MLDTLATAYAEAGRFPDAVRTAEQAVQLAAAAGNRTLVEKIHTRLELYRRKTLSSGAGNKALPRYWQGQSTRQSVPIEAMLVSQGVCLF